MRRRGKRDAAAAETRGARAQNARDDRAARDDRDARDDRAGAAAGDGALLRVVVALLIACTVFQRWGVLEACYTDAGALPVAAWRTAVGDDAVHRLLVAHAWSGALAWQRLLSALQLGAAAALAAGYYPRAAAAASLWLYASATARHVRLAFILDRYAHILLLWLAAAPAGACRAAKTARALFWLQLLWVYYDAGSAKFLDPDRGWAYDAPTPALDARVRRADYFADDTPRLGRGYSVGDESRRRRGCDVDILWRRARRRGGRDVPPAAARDGDPPSEYPRGTPRRGRDSPVRRGYFAEASATPRPRRG